MKALKEKRISLRSLWRRGLVILSLFALVFASCGDSSSGTTSDSGGKRVVKASLLTGPTNDQYLGQPVDLEGVTVRAWYSDGSGPEVISVKGNKDFVPWPRVVTGVYTTGSNGLYGFSPMTSFLLTYSNGVSIEAVDVPITEHRIWGIVRNNTTNNTAPDMVTNDRGSYALGLQLTGANRMAKKAYYVDADVVDFSGLALEADYAYYDVLSGNTLWDRKEISFENVTWRIIPDYPNGPNADGSYPGFLEITAGDFLGMASSATFSGGLSGEGLIPSLPAGTTGYGITVAAPLDTVWTVDEISINKTAADLEDYFFWLPNTKADWIRRLGDAKLSIKYTGGAEPRTLPVLDIWENQRIWWNNNPSEGGPSYNNKIDYDFDIIPIQYPLTTKGNKDPKILIYYRGHFTEIEIPVYTNLMGVDVKPKDGNEIRFNPAAKRDNDNDYGLPGSAGLASMLTVTATYAAYNDTQKTADVELVYIGQLARQWRYTPAAMYGGEYIPFYEFQSDDASYAKGYGKWLAQYRKGAKGKPEINQAVTVTHFVDPYGLWDSAGTMNMSNGSLVSTIYGPGASFPPVLTPSSTFDSTKQNVGDIVNQYIDDLLVPGAVTDSDPDTLVANPQWYYSYPGISWYRPLTEGTWTGTTVHPKNGSVNTIPNFTGNYVKDKGWQWIVTNPATDNGSGLKTAKAKKATQQVTWIVKN